MNASRRKALNKLKAELEQIKEDVSTHFERLAELSGELETINDEEQDAYDNMPEGLQSGDKGYAAQSAINAMDSALSTLSDFEDLGDKLDEVISSLDEAVQP